MYRMAVTLRLGRQISVKTEIRGLEIDTRLAKSLRGMLVSTALPSAEARLMGVFAFCIAT
jgi:hypothetical protein